MNGKWDHSTKPSTYKLLDKDGKVSYSGSFKDCMEKNNMNEQMSEQLNYQKGYDKGFSDAQEFLAQKMSKTIMDDRDAGYDQGLKDCYKILSEQLNEMIDGCRVQDEYAFKLIKDKLFNNEL